MRRGAEMVEPTPMRRSVGSFARREDSQRQRPCERHRHEVPLASAFERHVAAQDTDSTVVQWNKLACGSLVPEREEFLDGDRTAEQTLVVLMLRSHQRLLNNYFGCHCNTLHQVILVRFQQCLFGSRKVFHTLMDEWRGSRLDLIVF